MSPDDYFFYHKRYLTFQEKKEKFSYLLKKKLFDFLTENKFFKRKLDRIDMYTKYRNGEDLHIARNYYADKIIGNNNLKNYKEFSLPYISFFEVIEIDKFDRFRKSLIANFSSKHSSFYREIKFEDELKEKLSKIKTDLNTSSFDKLVNLNFQKFRTRHCDYIDGITLSFLKTNESYFILHIEVVPSIIFKKKLNQVLGAPETGMMVKHFHSLANIIKHKVFTGYTSFKSSLTRENLENLISDLQFQIEYNILKPLKGYFISSDLLNRIPRIEHYTVSDFKNHKENKSLWPFLNYQEFVQFTSQDELVDIYLHEENNVAYIFKEKEHGGKSTTESDLTDYDRMESYFLIKSMTFPCAFNSILNQEFSKLNCIKRGMYDFFEETNRWNFFSSFFLFRQNFKYLKLKKEITKLNLITNRFKNEFNRHSLSFLINFSGDMSRYKIISRNRTEENELNLLEYFIRFFDFRIKDLARKKDGVNSIFKNIEELNSYRTNFILQIVSILIGALAFLFAFEKVRDFLVALMSLL